MAKKRIIGNPTTTPYNPNKITITVDSELSLTSENPVQNKVVYEALKSKLDGYIHGNQFDIDNYTTAGRYYIQAAHPSYPSYHLFVVARPIMGCTQYKIGAYGDISTRTWKGLTNTDDGSNIWTDWKDVVFSSDIENLVPFVVGATVEKGIDNVGNEYLSIKYDGDSNELGYDIIEAYKAKKQIILKLTDENEPRYVHYSSECEWFEYGIIRWHIHIEEKCYTVLLAAMEQDDNYNAFWQIYPDENATKQYVDNAIGDIETSLENIIARYGLGGDNV